jgi:hypothetical protein
VVEGSLPQGRLPHIHLKFMYLGNNAQPDGSSSSRFRSARAEEEQGAFLHTVSLSIQVECTYIDSSLRLSRYCTTACKPGGLAVEAHMSLILTVELTAWHDARDSM